MKKKKFIFILFLLTIILIFYYIYTNYLNTPRPIEASKYMEFKIDFGHEIIFDDTTKKSIIVQNKDQNPVAAYVFLSADKKSILINPPIAGFIPGETYSITVSPGIHFQDYKLKAKKYIPFKIAKNDIQLPVKIKKKAQYGDIVGVSDEFMGYKYNHYGIYVGNNKVIHYISSTGKAEDSKISETNMNTYFKEDRYFVLDLKNSSKFTADQTVKRAKERLGEKSYDLLQNNCEHFVIWCKTDNSKSYQIDNLSQQQLNQLRVLISIGVNLQY